MTEPYVTFGRHPLCTVAFDAEDDAEVSGRHAAVFHEGGLFVLHDLGSTNGTFVNGHRLHADHILATDDVIQFGRRGPTMRVTIVREDAVPYQPVTPSPRHYSTIPPRRTKEETPPRALASPEGLGGTVTRFRAEVQRRVSRYRRGLWALALITASLAVVVWWQLGATAERQARERSDLLGRVASLSRQIDSMSVQVQSLRIALQDEQAETDRLGSLIANEQSSPEQVRTLSRQLRVALDRQERMLTAAAVDFGSHAQANLDAVALIVVQRSSGTSYTGTGFAIHSNDDETFVLTNKHVVIAEDGGGPAELGVVFNRSTQNFHADVAAIHPQHDLVLLRVPVAGGVPIVRGLAWDDPPTTVGSPVAIIGYPLGLDLPMGGDWTTAGISATMMTGTVTRVVPQLLQLDGYGAEGSSGSPIFDGEGLVVGVVYGGEPESDGRILYGVPIVAGLELLDRVTADGSGQQ